MQINKIYNEDCVSTLSRIDNNSVDLCLTSPPYWACRDYGDDRQIGLEKNPLDYIDKLYNIFSIIYQKLKRNGNLFIVIDDVWVSNWNNGREHTWISSKKEDFRSYQESIPHSKIEPNWSKKLDIDWIKVKQKLLLPERLSIKLQESGWYVREKIIWHKINCGNYVRITDRFCHSYEQIWHFAKSQKYYFDMDKIKENKLEHDVWDIPINKQKSNHSATFPEKLVEKIINVACPNNGIVLDPFSGTGTTCRVAKKLGRNYIGSEISTEYCEIADRLCRLEGEKQ